MDIILFKAFEINLFFHSFFYIVYNWLDLISRWRHLLNNDRNKVFIRWVIFYYSLLYFRISFKNYCIVFPLVGWSAVSFITSNNRAGLGTFDNGLICIPFGFCSRSFGVAGLLVETDGYVPVIFYRENTRWWWAALNAHVSLPNLAVSWLQISRNFWGWLRGSIRTHPTCKCSFHLRGFFDFAFDVKRVSNTLYTYGILELANERKIKNHRFLLGWVIRNHIDTVG